MVDVMQGLVAEAKRNKYSTIGVSLGDEDVISVWDNVSSYIEKQMNNQKGVHISGLGTFTFSQKKLDVGNNKYILIQRPVFLLSEKFAQTHGLHCPKYHVTGQIPVVQLNFSALSFESPFDRDNVEACVKEVLQAMSRSVGAKKTVDFSFSGIGRLQIKDNRVKMKFYKDFINSMDGSGKLFESLKDRPGTVDSVISNRSPTRAFSQNTFVLPRISSGNLGLEPDTARGAGNAMPTIDEEEGRGDADFKADLGATNQDPDVFVRVNADEEIGAVGGGGGGVYDENDIIVDIDIGGPEAAEPLPMKGRGSRLGSRMSVQMAQATGISLMDDLLPQVSAPKFPGRNSALSKSSPGPLTGRHSLSPINHPVNSAHTPRLTPLADIDAYRSQSAEHVGTDRSHLLPSPPKLANSLPKPQATTKAPSPPGSACGHKNAGQELCYLCHQRDRRNVPVYFAEERAHREREEDRLLQQFQHMKDTEAILTEQEQNLSKRNENQKMAAFNLGVAEAISSKKNARPTDFHPSYIFQKRPLTPPRFIKQEQYFNNLSDQVNVKDDIAKKRKGDEEFLERLEQVQLAEDLAAQREQYLRDKQEQQDQYKRALSAQINVRDICRISPPNTANKLRANKRMGPLTLPKPQIIVPFGQTVPIRIQISGASGEGVKLKTVRFKPLPLPSRVPDSSEPVFGKHDMTNEGMAERRRRAHDLYKEQLNTCEQRKRDAILRQLNEQKDEDSMLKRTKQELLNDRAERFERMFLSRKKLEDDWASAVESKHNREADERAHARSPGQLVHEQCDRYKRCGQCARRVHNCGESNIWRESRYIPGSRLMV